MAYVVDEEYARLNPVPPALSFQIMLRGEEPLVIPDNLAAYFYFRIRSFTSGLVPSTKDCPIEGGNPVWQSGEGFPVG